MSIVAPARPDQSRREVMRMAAAVLFGQGVTNIGTWASRVGLILAVVSTPQGAVASAAVVAIDSVPRALFARRIGRLIRRLTPAKAFVIGSVGEAALTMLCIPALSVSTIFLLAVVLLRTLFSCSLLITLQSATPVLFGRGQEIRQLNFALGLVNALAVIAGPMVGAALWQVGGLEVLLSIDALSSLIAMLVVIRPLRSLGDWPATPNISGPPDRRLDTQPLVVANTVAVAGGGIFNVLLPIYAVSTLNLSAHGVGFLFASFGAGAIAITLVGSLVKGRISAVHVYRAGFITSASAMAGLGLAILLPALLVFLAGCASALRAVGVLTRLQEVTADNNLPSVMADFQAHTSSGLAVGSLGGTMLALLVSPRAGLMAVTALSLAALILSLSEHRRKDAAPAPS